MQNINEQNDKTIPNTLLFNKRLSSNILKKPCPLLGKYDSIDYKNVELLKEYIANNAKIIGSRVSSVKSKHQRKLKQAIKRARQIALLSYTN